MPWRTWVPTKIRMFFTCSLTSKFYQVIKYGNAGNAQESLRQMQKSLKKKTHQTQHLQDPQDVAHLSVRDLMLLDMKARIQGIELEPESNFMGIYRYLWIFTGFIGFNGIR